MSRYEAAETADAASAVLLPSRRRSARLVLPAAELPAVGHQRRLRRRYP